MAEQQQTKTKVMINTGHSGGHILPALAVADALRIRNCDVVWLGAHAGLESELVPQHDIPIRYVNIQAVRGKGVLAWLLLPGRLLRAVWQALRAFRKERPDVVFTTGSYVAGPGGIAAWLTRTPLVVHALDSIPGLTLRVLGRLAKARSEGFENSFDGRGRWLGNPMNPHILRSPVLQQRASARFVARQGPARVFITGGSQGAQVLNETVPHALALLNERHPEQVIEVQHQCGRNKRTSAEVNYQQAGVAATIVEFIDDMLQMWRWADVVICRAGAMTVTELAAVGVPAVFVPLPPYADDHQSRNAASLVKVGAALAIEQSDLTAQRLADALEPIVFDRKRAGQMADQARTWIKPNAANDIAQLCLSCIDKPARAQGAMI